MYIALIIFLIALFIFALVITFFALRQSETNKDIATDDPQSDHERSVAYETTSLKVNLRLLVWIYSVTFLIAIIAFLIYVY